jgi:flagellin
MALSDLQKLFIVTTANQTWQQDMLMNVYFQGSAVGANLREMILGREPIRPLTNPYDAAMTGRLRADSAAIRRAGGNVKEASAMVGIAAEGVGIIKSTLEEMQALAKQIKDGDLTYSANVASQYNALRDKITGTIESTMHNGIYLLDSAKWGTSQIDSQGNVFIQAYPKGAGGGFDVTFQQLDKTGLAGLSGTGLSDSPSGSLQAELDKLSGYVGDMKTLEDIYRQRRDGLHYQSAALESQADLLDQAVEARKQTPSLSLEEILLRLLMRNTGTLFDQNS